METEEMPQKEEDLPLREQQSWDGSELESNGELPPLKYDSKNKVESNESRNHVPHLYNFETLVPKYLYITMYG